MHPRQPLVIQLSYEDLEIMLVSLKANKEVNTEKLKEATKLNHIAQIRRFTMNVNRVEKIEDQVITEIKKIRAEKFERHRQSKKYHRGVLGNSRLIK